MATPPPEPAASNDEPTPLPATHPGASGRQAGGRTDEALLAVCFPRDDPGFVERVQDLFHGSHPDRPFAAAVQALLRETYPQAVISHRHELADLDGCRVYYVFRDGSLVPHVAGEIR